MQSIVYLYGGILFSLKKREILPFETTEMNLKNIILSKISQTQKDRIMHDLVYMWNLIKSNS